MIPFFLIKTFPYFLKLFVNFHAVLSIVFMITNSLFRHLWSSLHLVCFAACSSSVNHGQVGLNVIILVSNGACLSISTFV